ncbi:hypothetical protein AEA42_20780 [Shewanella sp. Sh95]|nr:hypothetical protein AEA42_20780 [Shewanella sp. Sh95]
MIEDKYPIVLIHGRRLAEEVAKLVYESEAYSNVAEFLIAMDAVYPSRLKQRQAEEILNN